MTRIAVARLWFEGNRFSPSPTTLADFERREWRSGADALAGAVGTATELGAVAARAAARPAWRFDALRCASASPGGPIEEAVFRRWLGEVLDGLRAVRPDGVYLSLHGAAITTARDTPELDALRAIRGLLGEHVPVVASFDLHANLSPAIVPLLDFATGYRTHPHVDMQETADRALDALERRLAGGQRPVGAIVPLGRMLPSFNMRTDAGPMAEIEALARQAEADGTVLDATPFGGFPYADTADTGASAMAWAPAGAGGAQAATRVARALAEAMTARAAAFEPRLLAPRDGILRALAAPAGLVAVTDPADNPLSGGGADTPALFATLLAMRREAGGPVGALAAGTIAFAFFADAALVARALATDAGATFDALLGATHGACFGPGVPVRARRQHATDGRFVNTGPMERGAAVDVGPSVVLDVEGIRVVATSAVGAANDPGFFALHGIDLQATRLLCVKAKNHFRAAFALRCRTIVDVDCPGPAAADLSSLPFRRARPVPRRGGPDASGPVGSGGRSEA
jgi:microcystin degradation protein MlrC